MKYFWLPPDDQRHNNFVLFREASKGRPVTLREQYLSLQCTRCKKFDEVAAMRIGLAEEIKIRARTDVVSCDYGLIAASHRLRCLLEEHEIGGVGFSTLPSDENYAIMIPELIVKTDPASCGLERHRVCGECGRARETTLFPVLESMQLPEKASVIFSSSVWLENTFTRSFMFLADQPVIDVFKQHKISGVQYYPAY